MARLLQIAQLGHPVLRRTADRIDGKDDLQSLIHDLMATVADVNGVGIAAPQVYDSRQVFIMASKPNPRYPDAPDMDPQVVINPEILEASAETEKGWEGCLSIPGIRALVPRHTWVNVKFYATDGQVIETRFTGFLARIFQHEFDHLKGMVFLDRIASTRDIITEKEFFKRMPS